MSYIPSYFSWPVARSQQQVIATGKNDRAGSQVDGPRCGHEGVWCWLVVHHPSKGLMQPIPRPTGVYCCCCCMSAAAAAAAVAVATSSAEVENPCTA